MGFGLPAAIGAALVNSGAPVVCLTGDGSLLINIQELATLAELDLDVRIVLLDNAALGLVRQQQELFYSKRFVASRFARGTDFVSIAAAFQIRATDLATESDLATALEQAMNTARTVAHSCADRRDRARTSVCQTRWRQRQSLDHPE